MASFRDLLDFELGPLPLAHRRRLRNSNALERFNKELKRRNGM